MALGGVIVPARDAAVGGSLTEINSTNLYETLMAGLSSEWEGWSWVFAIISLSIFLVLLVLALLITALLPKPVLVVSEAISENTFKVVLWGLLGLVMIAPLALLLTISVVGIALIPLEVIIVACSILLGFIAVGQRIGRGVLRLLRHPHPSLARETFWGLVILWLIGWLPYIGWMVKAVAIVVGLGAVLVTRFGTHQGWKCTPAPPVSAIPTAPAVPEAWVTPPGPAVQTPPPASTVQMPAPTQPPLPETTATPPPDPGVANAPAPGGPENIPPSDSSRYPL